MVYTLKKIQKILIISIFNISLIGCNTTSIVQIQEQKPEESTPTTPEPNIKTVPTIPTKTITANGYSIEMGKSWAYMAASTVGQENAYTVDQYPGLESNFNGNKVLATVFVNRIISSEKNYLDDFLTLYNDFQLIESKNHKSNYFLVMSRKSDRNSLRYINLFYHPTLKQALAYNITFRVIGNEQTYRKTYGVDKVAQEILSFFTIT